MFLRFLVDVKCHNIKWISFNDAVEQDWQCNPKSELTCILCWVVICLLNILSIDAHRKNATILQWSYHP